MFGKFRDTYVLTSSTPLPTHLSGQALGLVEMTFISHRMTNVEPHSS